MSLRVKAVKAVRWTAAKSVGDIGSRFVITLVAAHVLTPSDFGLYALVNLVLGVANIFAAGGLTQGIVSKQDVTPDQLSSLFWLNLLSGILLSLLVGLAAPLLAEFYQQPKLLGMLLVAALSLMASPLGQTSQALLQRNLHFASLGLVDLSVSALNCVCAIGLLYAGVGVYSLIIAQVMATAVRGVLLRASCRGLLRVRLRFDFAEIRPLVNFGMFQTGSGLVNYLSGRLDQFLIGTLLGPQALGYYSLAWTLIMEPVFRITPVIISVAFPVFAQRQNDRSALNRGFLIVTKMVTMTIAPMVFGFAAIAPGVIPLVLGDKWTPSVQLVELLSIIAIVRVINAPIGPLVLAVGQANKLFFWTVGYSVVQAPLYAAFIAVGGLIPATVCLCIVRVPATYLAYVYLVRPILGPVMAEYMSAFLPATGLAVAMAIAVRSVSMLSLGSSSALLAAQLVLGVALYAGMTILFRRSDVSELASLVMPRRSVRPTA